MFVAVAAAGMLASCSSDSLTAGPDPKIEPTQEERVPIQLSVSSPSVRATTRGTGTVGGVGDGENKWYGQTINAFMFEKGTLTLAKESEDGPVLYDNAAMITPGEGNAIPGSTAPSNIGEAMLNGGDIKYYPPVGNFDFFGYHGDDAVTEAVDKSADPWVVPFVIDGSQDLMSTKAVLLEQEDPGTIKQATAMGESTDFYSAKAARKGVQPILQFDHLLSRLSFVIVPGTAEAAGEWVGDQAATYYNTLEEYNDAIDPDITQDEFDALTQEEKIKDPAVAAHQDATYAVYVKSIQVESKTTGKMAVAWTENPGDKIIWDNNNTPEDDTDDGVPAWLTLKDRPAYKLLSAADNPAKYITATAYNQLPDDVDGDENSKNDYVAINPNANYNLIALTKTCPILTQDYDADHLEETPVGEALIVAPSATNYNMKVNVEQIVETNWITSNPQAKEMAYDLEIPAPDGGFKANTSYKVVLTVYGFERIKVTTMIIPWEEGAPINVGQD